MYKYFKNIQEYTCKVYIYIYMYTHTYVVRFVRKTKEC